MSRHTKHGASANRPNQDNPASIAKVALLANPKIESLLRGTPPLTGSEERAARCTIDSTENVISSNVSPPTTPEIT